jgi:foldase protein PrsA
VGCDSNGTVATVGDEEISVTEFKYFLRIAKLSIETEEEIVPTSSEDSDMEKYEKEKEKFWKVEKNLENLRTEALEEAKKFKIQIAKAKENKISLTDEEKTQTTEQIETNFTTQSGSLEDAEKDIKENYNVTLDELKDIALDYYLINKFVETEISEIEVDDATLEEEYEKDKDAYDSVTIQHILFSTVSEDDTELTEDDIKKKKEEADKVLKMVKDGESFKELATEYSEDPGSKDNSGEYTISKNGQMVEEFETWAFEAKEDDVGLIETDYGYHIMKFVKRTTFEDEDVKSAVKSTVQQDQYQKELSEWTEDDAFKLNKNDDAIENTDIGTI